MPGADLGVLAILIMGPLSALACVSLLRWARRDDGPHARPLRLAGWLSFGVPALYLFCVAVGMTTGDTSVVSVLEDCVTLGLGLAAWAGIVRYGLFKIRAVLSRALVYGALSVVLVAVYLVTVVLVDRFFAGALVHAAAAVAAALCVLPLRDLAQRRVNRLVYGLRDDPAAALARLGERLDDAGDVLLAAARTVAEVLRLPYVAIEVDGAVLAGHGRRLPGTVRTLPLPFAGDDIGHLIVQPRDQGELTSAEHRLLSDLSRQVAVAAHAVTLTIALRQSRQRLVATREEERRRLRRDLHDGLGPTLAGIALGIDTACRAVPDGSPTQTLLAALREETESAVADIRRIVYALRPPILDELGLAGAIREQAVRLGAEAIDVPAELPALPAAVEVAAYHIAMEALTNANRHAPGSPVSVSLSVNGRLELSIRDGGAGLPSGHRSGVGLASMSERAEELGGTCVVRPPPAPRHRSRRRVPPRRYGEPGPAGRAGAGMTIRVLIADDHPLYREGLRALISDSAETSLPGVAAGGVEAVSLALSQTPDVIVMDLRMPDLNGVEATRRILAERPSVAILVLTMVEDDASVFAAMRAGARGYVLKGSGPETILRSIVAVAGGDAVFGAGVAARLTQFFATAGPATAVPFPELTGREREILELMATGAANAAIAARLHLTEKTVRNNVSNVFAKLRVADRAAAVARARDAGLGAQ